MDEPQKEALLREFRTYLDAVDAYPAENEPPLLGGTGRVSLQTLLSELAALRTEVRTEARQFKGSLDQFREVFATLRGGYTTLERQAAQRVTDQEALRREILRPLLLQILEVRDRMVNSLPVATALPAKKWWGRWCHHDNRLAESLRAGQEMNLRRLDKLIASYQIHPIATEGQPHDPFTMTVIETDNRTDLGPGIVTEEIRRGYLWGTDLLRPAEVKVNRGSASFQSQDTIK